MLDNHELCTVDDSCLVVNIQQEEYNIPGGSFSTEQYICGVNSNGPSSCCCPTNTTILVASLGFIAKFMCLKQQEILLYCSHLNI